LPVAVRRRRTLIGLCLSLFLAACYWFFPHIHPLFVSRGPVAPVYNDERWGRLEEIRSLIYFTTLSATSVNQNALLALREDDPSKYTEHRLTPYTFGAMSEDAVAKWKDNMYKLDDEWPLVIFSKTYCPYSKKAKALIQRYNVQPQPLIIEVDLREDADVIKAQLHRLTGRATFPNIIIQARSIGGSDDIEELHDAGLLAILLRTGGLSLGVPQ